MAVRNGRTQESLGSEGSIMIQPLKRVITLHLPVKLIQALQETAESLRISPSELVRRLIKLPIELPNARARNQAKVTRHCSRCGTEFQCYPYQRYTTCLKHRGRHLKGFVQPANAHPLKDWKEEE